MLTEMPIMGDSLSDEKTLIPMSLITRCEARAQKNHEQSLQRLAERGGVCPGELRCLVEDKDLRDHDWSDSSAAQDRRWFEGWFQSVKTS